MLTQNRGNRKHLLLWQKQTCTQNVNCHGEYKNPSKARFMQIGFYWYGWIFIDFLQSNKTLVNTASFCFSVLYTKEYAMVCGLIKFWLCGFVAFLFVLTELGFLLFLICGMQCALIIGHVLTGPQNHCCSSWCVFLTDPQLCIQILIVGQQTVLLLEKHFHVELC